VDFRGYAAQTDDRLDLLTGAILVASDAYPGLNAAALERQLSGLSSAIDRSRLARLPAAAQARVLSDHLYVACGFHGNDAAYYDPRNSYLNEVLARRTGIPISLAVVYIEVARRLGVPASPVGFPGHFLVRIDDGERRVIVDPFHGGRVLSDTALAKLLRRTGYKQPLVPEMLAPTPIRHVIARMLMNLRGVYSMLGDSARVLVVLDRMIELLPEAGVGGVRPQALRRTPTARWRRPRGAALDRALRIDRRARTTPLGPSSAPGHGRKGHVRKTPFRSRRA
jgi:regulator of sirC expression with transglutaminase-like and TPR domain